MNNTSLKEKLTSPVLWIGAGAIIAFFIKEFAGIDVQPQVDEFLNIFLPILALFSVANNPNSKNSF